mmetsp:Transcript_58635/g.182110  ORF Transcript_58635/g.182110 Transcript_58635/m.182110 type:complete len:216 (+) Transcript_58635:479-1126(+)
MAAADGPAVEVEEDLHHHADSHEGRRESVDGSLVLVARAIVGNDLIDMVGAKSPRPERGVGPAQLVLLLKEPAQGRGRGGVLGVIPQQGLERVQGHGQHRRAHEGAEEEHAQRREAALANGVPVHVPVVAHTPLRQGHDETAENVPQRVEHGRPDQDAPCRHVHHAFGHGQAYSSCPQGEADGRPLLPGACRICLSVPGRHRSNSRTLANPAQAS